MCCVSYLCVVRFDRWVFTQFRVSVFVVYVVANTNELLATVRAGDEHYGDTHSITLGNQACVGGIRLTGNNHRYMIK